MRPIPVATRKVPVCTIVCSACQVAADLVHCDELDVTFEDIAGMEDIKHSLQEIISEPLDFPPDLYPVRAAPANAKCELFCPSGSILQRS